MTLLTRKARWISVGLAIYWGVIFLLTHIPLPKASHSAGRLPHTDKIVHFTFYFGLSFLLVWLLSQRRRPIWMTVAMTLGLVCLYGCIDELLQQLIPSRSADVLDLLADALGGTAGIVGFFTARRIRRIGRAPTLRVDSEGASSA